MIEPFTDSPMFVTEDNFPINLNMECFGGEDGPTMRKICKQHRKA